MYVSCYAMCVHMWCAGEDDRALDRAVESGDSDLVFQVSVCGRICKRCGEYAFTTPRPLSRIVISTASLSRSDKIGSGQSGDGLPCPQVVHTWWRRLDRGAASTSGQVGTRAQNVQ